MEKPEKIFYEQNVKMYFTSLKTGKPKNWILEKVYLMNNKTGNPDLL